ERLGDGSGNEDEAEKDASQERRGAVGQGLERAALHTGRTPTGCEKFVPLPPRAGASMTPCRTCQTVAGANGDSLGDRSCESAARATRRAQRSVPARSAMAWAPGARRHQAVPIERTVAARRQATSAEARLPRASTSRPAWISASSSPARRSATRPAPPPPAYAARVTSSRSVVYARRTTETP